MIRRLFGNLLLAAVAVAFTLAAAELLARTLVPAWVPEGAERSFWQYDPLLGWSHVPGQSGVHRHQDFAVTVEINDLGLRDRSYPETPPEAGTRVLVLGDSFAWGQGAEREDLWHEILERRHEDVEFINAAVAGYGTSQQLLYFEERGAQFAPDVVVLMLHPNDFLDNNEPFRYGYFKPQHVLAEDGTLELTQVPVPRLSFEQRFDRYLRFHTYFLYRLYHFPEFFEAWRESRSEQRSAAPDRKPAKPKEQAGEKKKRKKKEGGKKGKRTERVGDSAPVRPAPRPSKYDVDLALTIRLLVELRDRVEEAGARFLLVTVPMPDPPRGAFATGVAEAGIAHLALDEAFESATEPIRYRHDPHWNAAGHQLAAEAIAPLLPRN